MLTSQLCPYIIWLTGEVSRAALPRRRSWE